jgi:hypothetical protein
LYDIFHRLGVDDGFETAVPSSNSAEYDESAAYSDAQTILGQ